MLRHLSLLALLVGTAASGCAGRRTSSAAGVAQSLAVGQPVPSFAVARLDGTATSLRAFRGHAVFANVWATWCPPCRHEMPALERIARGYAARGLVVAGIDQGESDKVVRRFVRSIGVTYPILMDREQQYGTTFEVVGLPTTVFVRPDGMVDQKFTGELSWSQMHDEAERLVGHAPAADQVAPLSRDRTSTAR